MELHVEVAVSVFTWSQSEEVNFDWIVSSIWINKGIQCHGNELSGWKAPQEKFGINNYLLLSFQAG